MITFGQPPAIDSPCPLIASSRWYRYVNTKAAETFRFGIVYDPVPFSPGLGADNFGHMILLSEDNTGVAYIGLDAQDYFGPPNVNGFEAHSMVSANGTYPGYLDRIEVIMGEYANGTYPVRTSGYIAGSLCTEDKECESSSCQRETSFSYKRCVGTRCKKDKDCETDRCDSGVCIPKLGSCQPCDEHSDCLYGTCGWNFQCTGERGLMDNGCSCNFNADCQSARCEGISTRLCEATLPLGAYCDESSDCESGYCSWGFRCASESWWRNATIADDETNSQLPPTDSGGKGMLLVMGSVLAGLVVLVVSLMGWQRRRRREYEEIPTELTV